MGTGGCASAAVKTAQTNNNHPLSISTIISMQCGKQLDLPLQGHIARGETLNGVASHHISPGQLKECNALMGKACMLNVEDSSLLPRHHNITYSCSAQHPTALHANAYWDCSSCGKELILQVDLVMAYRIRVSRPATAAANRRSQI